MANLTPQQLMDMPYAGMAEKKLRKEGRWRLTQQEIAFNKLNDALSAIQEVEYCVNEAMEATCN